MCSAVIDVSLCSQCSPLTSQVWETKCILKWKKPEIDAWLTEMGWSKHIVALDVANGQVLATRSIDDFKADISDNPRCAGDIFKAVGLLLEEHHDDNKWIEDAKFRRIMRARGGYSPRRAALRLRTLFVSPTFTPILPRYPQAPRSPVVMLGQQVRSLHLCHCCLAAHFS